MAQRYVPKKVKGVGDFLSWQYGGTSHVFLKQGVEKKNTIGFSALFASIFFFSCVPNPRYTPLSTVTGSKLLRHSDFSQREVEARDSSSEVHSDTIVGNRGIARYRLADRSVQRSDVQRLVGIVQTYLGIPYRKGGTTREGLDCSGLVWTVFQEYDGRVLPRSSKEMASQGHPVAAPFFRTGDLLFFYHSPRIKRITHVGIFLDGREFVHSSSTLGVTISNLDDKYYSKRFAFARRIIK